MRRTGWWMAGLLVCWGPAGAHAQSVNMGTTFHELEGRAERVVVTFDDAEVETRREADGSWRASLRNAQGRLLLTQLGQLIPKEKKVQRTETGYGTWRKYLKSMPDLYVLEGAGNDVTVRLKRP